MFCLRKTVQRSTHDRYAKNRVVTPLNDRNCFSHTPKYRSRRDCGAINTYISMRMAAGLCILGGAFDFALAVAIFSWRFFCDLAAVPT